MRALVGGWYVCAIIGCLVACGDDNRASGDDDDDGSGGRTTATLTVQRTGTGHGEVSAQGVDFACGAVCSATVAIGSTVSVVATPDGDAVFGGWTAPGCSTDATCTIVVTRDTTLTAVFDLRTFTVEVGLLGAGAGTVMSSAGGLVCPGACSAKVAAGTTLTLTAAPTSSSVFLGWSDACTGDACTLTVSADVHVGATFAKQNELVVVKAGNGDGTVTAPGIACGADCSELYQAGSVVELVATPAADSVFVGWAGGDCTGTGACSVTVDAATQVTATFALAKRTLSVAKIGKGTVTSTPAGISCGADCAAPYDAHTVVALVATPDADSDFIGWSGACDGLGPCTVTLDDDAAVTATFALKQVALTVQLLGAGTGAVASVPAGIACPGACANSYDINAVVELIATPAPGMKLVAWGGACSGAATCQVTLATARAVTAQFEVARMVVADYMTGRISTFLATDHDDAAAQSSVFGNKTLLFRARGVAVYGGEVFVADQMRKTISVFPVGATGDVAPSRRITTTAIGSVTSVAIYEGELYAATAGAIVVLPLSANGNATPTRILSGLGSTAYIAISEGQIYASDYTNNRILVFPASTPSGEVAPTRIIGGLATPFIGVNGVFVDGNELFVTSINSPRISVYDKRAEGVVAPLRVITGPMLEYPDQIVVFNNEIYVAEYSKLQVVVFPRNASGNAAPARQLMGPLPGMNPSGVWVY